jgi:L-ascorbate metabolism protein UlaG (beta-lactamase superfamily)
MLVQICIVTILFSFALPAFAQKDLEGISEFYQTRINEGQVAYMWLGEGKGQMSGVASAGVMVKTSQHIIIIDSSNIIQGDAIDALESLDLILITHEHGDHFHPDSTLAIHQKTDAPVIISAGAYPSLQDEIVNDKLIKMLPNDVKTVDGITVTAIPAVHPSDRPVMYLIKMDGITIFHGSDSGFTEEMNEIDSEVHIAFVPAGMPSPTASPDDAASMVRAMNPYVTVPVHGLFEQMKALEDMVGKETVMIIPAAFVVKVPTQIVPEFGFALPILMVSLVMVLLAILRTRPVLMCKDE